MTRGRHKIFIGMAAGVGKTFRMLQEGRLALAEGRDVVIGYLEPHDRADTIAQAQGLEVVPRRRVTYRETSLDEMDVEGIVKRLPDLALIDELAHTNAPGSEHAKRHEDVDEILDSGIDVYSTVNVQHLESLNDEVAEFTGVRVRETLPDTVLKEADEIVLIDLNPEALIARLQAGKIYEAERVPAALNNFFRVENLAALREVALRQVAEDVEAKRLTHEVVSRQGDRVVFDAAPQAVAERLLALVKPEPKSQRIVRRAWRASQRLGAQLDILWVADPSHEPSEHEQTQLNALSRLASVLGAHFIQESSDDLVATVARVAREKGSTYALLGTPASKGIKGQFSRALPMRLVDALPGVDIRIVADRARLVERGEE